MNKDTYKAMQYKQCQILMRINRTLFTKIYNTEDINESEFNKFLNNQTHEIKDKHIMSKYVNEMEKVYGVEAFDEFFNIESEDELEESL